MFVKVNEEEIEIPENSTARDLSELLNLRSPEEAIGVSINTTAKDLSHTLQDGDNITFFHFNDSAGKEIFWHTSAHVLAQAVLRLWPEAKPTIGPPIEGGFYYDFANLNISEKDLPSIEKEMKKIVKENYNTKKALFQIKKKL